MWKPILGAAGLILGSTAFFAPPAFAGEEDVFLRPFMAPLPLEADAEAWRMEETVHQNVGVFPDLTAFLAESLFPQSRPPARRPLFDFRRSELTPWIGVLHYSGDFEADPDFCLGVLYRVPMPALPTEKFGIFVQGSAAHIDRDIPEYYENRDGIFYTFAAGVDFTIARGKNLFLTAQAGAVYAAYGDIKGVDDGWGLLLGLMGGLRTTFFRPDSNVYLTYNPQMAIDGSDWFIVHALGLLFAF